MLAMSAARNNDTEKAIEWLLDPLFQFDDVGMPIGGVKVTTYVRSYILSRSLFIIFHACVGLISRPLVHYFMQRR